VGTQNSWGRKKIIKDVDRYVTEDSGLYGRMFKIRLREMGLDVKVEFDLLRREWQDFPTWN
jgi:hypothetical protein